MVKIITGRRKIVAPAATAGQSWPPTPMIVGMKGGAVLLTSGNAQTAPPFIPAQVGSGLTDWTVIAAGTFLFLLPVAIFTFALRGHLLRGVTFGAIRK